MDQQQLAAAFTLWRARYEADPEGFAAEWPSSSDYGEAAAVYLLQLLDEVAG